MNVLKLFATSAIVLLLAACGNDNANESNSGSVNDGQVPTDVNSALDHGVKDKSVGFEVAGGNIEQATNVPEDVKEEIVNTFTEYIEAFNAEDIDRYMEVIAKKPEGFNYDDEKDIVQGAFDQFDTVRNARDVTIVKYSKDEAQVFANIDIKMEQPTTGAAIERSGRQVTVFANEKGNWRVSSVYFIGDAE